METLEQKTQRQLEIEERGIEIGVKKYLDQMAKAYQTNTMSELPSGVALTSKLVEPVAAGIRGFLLVNSKGGKKNYVYTYLNALSDEYVLSYITVKTILNYVSDKETPKLQRVCEAIGSSILAELNVKQFRKTHKEYVDRIMKVKAQQNSSKGRTAKALKAMAEEKGATQTEWTTEELFWVGQKLLSIFIETTGLVMAQNFGRGTSSYTGLVPTQALISALKTLDEHCSLLNPTLLPMIVPPNDWSMGKRGGFLSEARSLQVSMVRTRNKAHRKLVNDTDMPVVYEALNTLQRTAWKINAPVAEVFLELWSRGEAIPELDLMAAEDIPEPIKPWGSLSSAEWEVFKAKNESQVNAWKHKKRDIINENIITRSKRIATERVAMLTRDYLKEEEFYFCWNLDFRSRIYPLQTFLNPQGNDLAKSLLKFKEGVELGEDGGFWLAVQGANTWGNDKVSLVDRECWVYDNEDMIKLIAEDPYTNREWHEASEPWKFLSFCFEWLAYANSNYSEDFISYSAVALDGSNNGVQHLSAVLRDPEGSRATNLTLTNDRPADIYQEVADLVTERLAVRVAENDPIAKLLLGKVDRNVAKRNTMTTAYGVTGRGRIDQLMSELKPRQEEFTDEANGIRFYDTMKYLADMNGKAIADIVVKAVEAMDWLKEVAKVVGKESKGFVWVTPSGFPVLQEYKKSTLKRVKSYWGEVRVDLSLQKELPKVDTAKGAIAIAPNWTHSNDASHLMLTIIACRDAGIMNFAMIHDSFGTHAGNTGRLSKIIRETFVGMYKGNILEDFRDQIVKQLSPETASELPPLPELGNFDLTQVLESEYFFA